ncbi:hypothetical protein PR202_gb04933 [Eleusine coracana subsp. coracana]|uniref:Uncharacterized protein n=1 Tax=Eleusine coracana subsp. coracana TaxID=191504 RepID=A0AAV5E5X7_ELECO|nr:hypothetical protein PR202_gb04933 [Eleusine coracana subsp. coracana]
MLTEKNNVSSFGVVLLELVTGKPPILEASENGHIIQWVRERTESGDIESIADPNMKDQYDVNCLCKVLILFLNCYHY